MRHEYHNTPPGITTGTPGHFWRTSMKTSLMWPWALAVAVVATVGAMQHLDATDIEASQTISQEHYEWLSAARQCMDQYGPQTQPEYTDDGKAIVCVTRRGEVLALGSGK